jgi:hypothetical protein
MSKNVLINSFDLTKLCQNLLKNIFSLYCILLNSFNFKLAEMSYLFLCIAATAVLLQTYAADIFFAQTWKDDRLRLPENMTSEYR